MKEITACQNKHKDEKGIDVTIIPPFYGSYDPEAGHEGKPGKQIIMTRLERSNLLTLFVINGSKFSLKTTLGILDAAVSFSLLLFNQILQNQVFIFFFTILYKFFFPSWPILISFIEWLKFFTWT